MMNAAGWGTGADCKREAVTKMSEDEMRELADLIAADLFTDGGGRVADRLVAVLEPVGRPRRELGGVGRSGRCGTASRR